MHAIKVGSLNSFTSIHSKNPLRNSGFLITHQLLTIPAMLKVFDGAPNVMPTS